MKLFPSKFVATLLGLASLVLVSSAQAALVTERFLVEVIDGDVALGETGSIEVEYDSDFIEGIDEELLFGDEFLLSMDIFGQTFTNEDDIGFFDFFPILTFDMGDIIFIDFRVNEFSLDNPTEINDVRIEEIGGGDVIDGVYEVLAFGTGVVPVPLPTTLALLVAGILGARSVRRQRV